MKIYSWKGIWLSAMMWPFGLVFSVALQILTELYLGDYVRTVNVVGMFVFSNWAFGVVMESLESNTNIWELAYPAISKVVLCLAVLSAMTPINY